MVLQSKLSNFAGMKFYTEQGVEITRRVLDGRTETFTEEAEAKLFASSKKSYSYPIDCSNSKEKHRTVKHYGFAVPK